MILQNDEGAGTLAPEVNEALSIDMNAWIDRGLESATGFGLNLIAALAILVVGLYISKLIGRIARRALERSKLDDTVTHFLSNLVSYALIVFVVIAALSRLGVQTSQFVAVLGAAGLAIGLAMEGSLSNFAAGVLIAVFRPFGIGDWVEAADAEGQVTNISIFYTTLLTLDNETIVIPNSEVTAGKVTNFSAGNFVRVEIPFVVGHEAEWSAVREIAMSVPRHCPRVIAEPPPEVQIIELAEAGVRAQVEVTTEAKDREDVMFEVSEVLKAGFDARAVRMPHRQLDVRVQEGRLPG